MTIINTVQRKHSSKNTTGLRLSGQEREGVTTGSSIRGPDERRRTTELRHEKGFTSRKQARALPNAEDRSSNPRTEREPSELETGRFLVMLREFQFSGQNKHRGGTRMKLNDLKRESEVKMKVG